MGEIGLVENELCLYQAGLIGGHYEKAKQPVQAVTWYEKAGKQSQTAYAPETAIHYYQKALVLLHREQIFEVFEPSKVYGFRIRLYKGLAEVLTTHVRYAEAIDAYTTMNAIAEAMKDVCSQIEAWNG